MVRHWVSGHAISQLLRIFYKLDLYIQARNFVL
jgi:hypothetical protein